MGGVFKEGQVTGDLIVAAQPFSAYCATTLTHCKSV